MIYFIQGEGGISHHFEEPFGFQKSQDRGKKYTFCNYAPPPANKPQLPVLNAKKYGILIKILSFSQ